MWFDSVTTYKNHAKAYNSSNRQCKKYNEVYTIHWVMYHTVHCDKQKRNKNRETMLFPKKLGRKLKLRTGKKLDRNEIERCSESATCRHSQCHSLCKHCTSLLNVGYWFHDTRSKYFVASSVKELFKPMTYT